MIRYFAQKAELGQNPFIGFTSFQHYKGEKLYSDVIVDLTKKSIETENFECYPIPDGVSENGRAEGFYPDGKIAYFRVLWKEFEPKRHKYNYKLIEDILDGAEKHGQTVMFRLMQHSTCARDDVPDWLKEMIPCPERPLGKRTKESPTAPEYIEFFGEAIEKLGERFDSDPRLDAVDICLSGCWGEGFGNCGYSEETMKRLMDRFTASFKNTRLLAQVAGPELARYCCLTHPVGWRGDGTGDPYHMNSFFPAVAEELDDLWIKAPVSFEAMFWLGEWYRRGYNIDEIIEKTLSWHISSFNGKSFPVPYEWKDKIDYWISKMGYHFWFKEAEYNDNRNKDEDLTCRLVFENTGVAPIYNDIPLTVRLKTSEGNTDIILDEDIKKWLPGEHSVTFTIPSSSLPNGDFELEIGMVKDNISIFFQTDAEYDNGFYKI